MSKALLAKLTTKSVNLNPVGGKPDITWQDVAQAIAGLNGFEHHFVRAVYCEDNKDSVATINHLACKYEQSTDFAFAALFEFTYPNHCSRCGGTGEIAAEACERCHGSGIVPVSDRQRAALMQRDRKYYKARESAYSDILEFLQDTDDKIVAHLKKKFREAA